MNKVYKDMPARKSMSSERSIQILLMVAIKLRGITQCLRTDAIGLEDQAEWLNLRELRVCKYVHNLHLEAVAIRGATYIACPNAEPKLPKSSARSNVNLREQRNMSSRNANCIRIRSSKAAINNHRVSVVIAYSTSGCRCFGESHAW